MSFLWMIPGTKPYQWILWFSDILKIISIVLMVNQQFLNLGNLSLRIAVLLFFVNFIRQAISK